VPDDVRRGGGDFLQVVRRDAGGEADRDAEAAVEQSKRQPGRQQHRLLEFPIVVPDEIDGALPDLAQYQLGESRQSGFRISIGCGRVAIARAEITLPVDQRIAHRERLREVDQRLVGRGVAVRVVLAQHFADVARALGKGLGAAGGLAHRVQDPSLDGLQPVGDLGQRPRLDRRHGVAEVGVRGVLLDRRGLVAAVRGEQIQGLGVFHRHLPRE